MSEFSCDFAVVGAGSAGCAVAARLSEDPNNDVILFEAGPSDHEFPSIYVPSEAALLQKTEMDWEYEVCYVGKAGLFEHKSIDRSCSCDCRICNYFPLPGSR